LNPMKLASIQIITDIRPVKGADRIEAATVLGYQTVISVERYTPCGRASAPSKPEYRARYPDAHPFGGRGSWEPQHVRLLVGRVWPSVISSRLVSSLAPPAARGRAVFHFHATRTPVPVMTSQAWLRRFNSAFAPRPGCKL